MNRAFLTNVPLLLAIALLVVNAFVALRSPANVSAQSLHWKVMMISPNDYGAKELEAQLNNGTLWKNVQVHRAADNGPAIVVMQY